MVKPESTSDNDSVILVDGSSYVYRAYHALPPLSTSTGQPTGAVRGVTTMVMRILEDHPDSPVGMIFDAKGSTFRHDMYDQYKANRPPMPDDLRPQIQPIYDISKALGLKIFVVDGFSSDKTIEIIKFFRLKDKRIELIENPKKFQSFALNLGIKRAKTKYIMRLDAHSWYPEDYVENCLLAIKRSGADNVGGIFISKLKTNSFQELVVASITTSVFGVGSSSFRIKHISGFVKTVPYGFFRRRVFKEIGLFNERLKRNQDYEFNRRMILNLSLIHI